MAITDDQAGEVIRKSGEQLNSGDNREYYIKTGQIGTKSYTTHYMDTTSKTLQWIGKSNLSGTWILIEEVIAAKISTYSFANISNNSGQATLAAAWTNRATLNFTTIDQLTGV